MRASAALLLCLVPFAAQAKPTRYAPSAPEFSGDRWVRVSQAGTTAPRAATRRHAPVHAGKWRYRHKGKPRLERYPVPGVVSPLKPIARASSVSLAGVVAPLAAKAREIVSACGSRIDSARIGREHSRVRGSGRPSLHRTGHAVDISGNPACIRAHLVGWPGGVSTDYARVGHYHFSYKPGGGEWGARFAHFRGSSRYRYAKRHGGRYAQHRRKPAIAATDTNIQYVMRGRE